MNKCGYCGQSAGFPDWKARALLIWSNQHGDKYRIFCDTCGAWTEIERRAGEEFGKVSVIKGPRGRYENRGKE